VEIAVGWNLIETVGQESTEGTGETGSADEDTKTKKKFTSTVKTRKSVSDTRLALV
jgi:hypothetical protein